MIKVPLSHDQMPPMQILIRLRECAGWSEYSLDAHVRGTLADASAQMYVVVFGFFLSES